MTEQLLLFFNMFVLAILAGTIVFLSCVPAPVLVRIPAADSFAKVARTLFPRYYGRGIVSATPGWTTRIILGLRKRYDPVALLSAIRSPGVLASEYDCRRTPLISQTNNLSDQLNAKQAGGFTAPVLRKQRDGLHRLSVQLHSVMFVMGLCLMSLSGASP
jgi:hypothetical protein